MKGCERGDGPKGPERNDGPTILRVLADAVRIVGTVVVVIYHVAQWLRDHC
jgi:hypothetical protein